MKQTQYGPRQEAPAKLPSATLSEASKEMMTSVQNAATQMSTASKSAAESINKATTDIKDAAKEVKESIQSAFTNGANTIWKTCSTLPKEMALDEKSQKAIDKVKEEMRSVPYQIRKAFDDEVERFHRWVRYLAVAFLIAGIAIAGSVYEAYTVESRVAEARKVSEEKELFYAYGSYVYYHNYETEGIWFRRFKKDYPNLADYLSKHNK